MAADTATPIANGEQEVSVTVDVLYIVSDEPGTAAPPPAVIAPPANSSPPPEPPATPAAPVAPADPAPAQGAAQ
jgi:hypothetical protein